MGLVDRALSWADSRCRVYWWRTRHAPTKLTVYANVALWLLGEARERLKR